MTSAAQTPKARLHRLAHDHGGYFTVAEAREAGVYPKLLQRWTDAGLVERVMRGVYRWPGQPPTEHDQLVELQLRFPFARFCLLTALDLHGLTTTQPGRIQLAVPRGRKLPPLAYPPTEVFSFTPEAYAYGTQLLAGAPRPLHTYTPEKTLADLLKFSRRFGKAPYLEGLKNYLRRPKPDARALVLAGQVDGVEQELRHDLEVLTHEANR